MFDVPAFAAAAVRRHIDIVIVTATDVERDAVRAVMHPIGGSVGLGRVRTRTQTYYIGVIGRYAVAHVECTMGAIGIGAAQNSVNDAIVFWAPKLVIMPGIAFGVDPEKQRLEDILIADCVVAYEPARIGVTSQIQRGGSIPAGHAILDRLRDERGRLHPEVASTARVGLLLSGEKLVDDPEFKSHLLSVYPTAIGGDMEGAGVASACQRHNVEWALVKAICDWGDGEKEKSHQMPAAQKAVDYVERVLFGIDLLPGIAANTSAGEFRLITGSRCTFVRTLADMGSIASLFDDARAGAHFGEQAASLLAHAAREVIRNALTHGRAVCGVVEIGEGQITLRDDGKIYDPRVLAHRIRALGRDAGSLVMANLTARTSVFQLEYRRDEDAYHNILIVRIHETSKPEIPAVCMLPPMHYQYDHTEVDTLIAAAKNCPEIHYDARRNVDISTSWRVINHILSMLDKNQLLIIENCDDETTRQMFREYNNPQLVLR